MTTPSSYVTSSLVVRALYKALTAAASPRLGQPGKLPCPHGMGQVY